jgi:hypothetical protein
MDPFFPVRLLVNMPQEPLMLTPERAQIPLPRDPDAGEPILTYGPYLEALYHFLSQNGYEPLRAALERHLHRPVPLKAIQGLDIYSEKHGAIYNVARVVTHLLKESHSLAINVAMQPEQQAFLEREFYVLDELHKRFGLPFLPRPYLQGETIYAGDEGTRVLLKLFLTEWFNDYHEFHLSQREGGRTPIIKIWNLEKGENFLDTERTHFLYHQAAAILTAYLDEQTFEQIYPWHHAAGDFVVRQQGEKVKLKMVTARDYRCLFSPGADPEERWLALVHFFFNLTIRMRLDRLDGTGEYAWANPDCLRGVLRGFLEAWNQKAMKNPSLPPSREMLDFVRSFSPREWHFIAELIFKDALVEADEISFLQQHLEEHIASLRWALKEAK